MIKILEDLLSDETSPQNVVNQLAASLSSNVSTIIWMDCHFLLCGIQLSMTVICRKANKTEICFRMMECIEIHMAAGSFILDTLVGGCQFSICSIQSKGNKASSTSRYENINDTRCVEQTSLPQFDETQPWAERE